MNPLTLPLDSNRAALERATGTVDRLRNAPDQAEKMAEVEVGGTPSDVIYEENKLELLRYDAEAAGIEPEADHDTPILFVYALINRPYILDLQPNRSVVRRLLEAGFDVYLIDWGEPSMLDTALGLDDYVNRYIDNCVDAVREDADRDAINVVGYCMGGTMSVMYAALYPEKVRNLGLMASGLCFAGTGGILELWGDDEYYDPGSVTDAFGNVPAEFLATGFDLMDPVNNYVTKYVQLYDNFENEEFVENFARMERWLADGIDVAGAVYEEFLEEIYQENNLYRNELEIAGEHVDLQEVDMPVAQIVGEYDHLVPPESSKPFNDRIPSEDTTVFEASVGHIGLSVSRSSHENLWPSVAEWFAERSAVAEPTAATVEDESTAVTVEDESAEDPTDDLESIQGIGSAYAERLREAGVTSIADLAEADPATLATDSDIAEGRIRSWIEDANERLGSDGDGHGDGDGDGDDDTET